jgi:shikimate kinase
MASPPMDRYAPLKARTIALVGMMGVGKSSVGRRLASALDLPFYDADSEVERAAGCSINDIFTDLGEAAFREGERRVIARLLEGPPHVLATGGGAFMNPETRRLIKDKAISVWLRADTGVLAKRLARKDNRPLLKGPEPPTVVLERLAQQRDPTYAEADIKVETSETPHQVTVEQVLQALSQYLRAADQ